MLDTATLPRPLVEGPSAWRGEDLQNRPETWTYVLSDAEIAELDAATKAVRAKGIGIADIRMADFPLPTFGKKLDELRKEVVDGRGFVLMRGLPVEGKPIAENATTFWGIGTYFGNAVSQNIRGHMLGHVRDVGVLAAENPHVRASQSRERQLFHTDGCDVVGLLCLRPAKSGGLSTIVSSMSIYNEMAKRRPDLAQRLFEPISFDRRGEIPDGKGPYYQMPVFNDHEGLLSVSFTGRNVGSVSRFPDAPPNPPEALGLFTDIAGDPALRLDMELRAGDMQFLHNHTILHDRTAYEDWPEPERKRHLLRLWIAAHEGRPLAPAFIERFGSVTVGARGGLFNKDTRFHVPLEAS